VAALVAAVAFGDDAASEGAPVGPPPFEEVVLESRSGTFLTEAEIQPLLEPVGAPYRLLSTPGQPVRFQGVARLDGWSESVLLRFATMDQGENLRIHVWGADEGVTLRFYAQGAAVGAYRTGVDPGAGAGGPTVPYGALVTSDDGRNQRLPSGLCFLGYADGCVFLNRGDIRLLAAPLKGPIKALYVESPAEVELRDLAIVESGPVPVEPARVQRVVVDGSKPAGLEWKGQLPEGARLERPADGTLELVSEKSAAIAQATFTLDAPGLYEVTFRVDQATTGTGVALFNDAGEPVEGIEFGRNREGKVVLGYGTPREALNVDAWAEESRPVPYAGPGQWIRLVVAGGMSRYWVGADGGFWGRVFEPRLRNGTWRSIGLFARETNDPQKPDGALRRIRLGGVMVRELEGLTSAVDPAVLAQARLVDAAFQPNEAPPAWLERTAKLIPAGSRPPEWRGACLLQALAANGPVDLTQGLVEAFVDERLEALDAAPRRAALLQDAALVWRSRPEDATVQIDFWERLGRSMLVGGDVPSVRAFARAYMQASIFAAPPRSGPLPRSLVGDVLLVLYAEQRLEPLEEFMRWLRFWFSDPATRQALQNEGRLMLYDMMNAKTGGPQDPTPPGAAEKSKPRQQQRGRRGWNAAGQGGMHQPVAVNVSRAADTFYAEMLSALEERHYDDMVRLFRANSPQYRREFVPSATDGQLYMLLPVAMRSIRRANQDFANVIGQPLSSAEQLLAEQVLTRQDPVGLERLAMQAVGTPAGAAACQSLGDRALAGGDFLRARAWYEEGLSEAAVDQRPHLQARLRLASAALGKPVGEPPREPVTVGTGRVSPERFEKEVAELASRTKDASVIAQPATGSPAATVFPVVQLRSAPWADVNEGAADPNAFPEFYRNRTWPLGNLQAVVADDLMIVSNRRRAVALELATGKQRWAHELGNATSPAPLRPTIEGGALYIRAMTSVRRYGLLCIDRKSGTVRWHADGGDNLVSDPVVVHGRLYVLAAAPVASEGNPAVGQFSATLVLLEIDRETGRIAARRKTSLPLWEQNGFTHECQIAWADGHLVVTILGAVLGLDLQGTIQWQRLSSALPMEADPGFTQQEWQPPLASGDRVYLHGTGSVAVECLASATGEVIWRRGVIGLQRIIGLFGDRLLVKSTRGIRSLDAKTGDVLWSRDLANALPGVAVVGGDAVLAARQIMLPDRSTVEFVWIDQATGAVKGRSELPLSSRDPVMLGPMLAADKRIWCFSNRGLGGDGQPPGNVRRVYELSPAAGAP
jgi:outer membrane protein assembly factor BamB